MTNLPVRVGLFADLVGGLWPSPSTQLRFLLAWEREDTVLVDGGLVRHASRTVVRQLIDVAVFQRLEIANEENHGVLQSLQRDGIPIIVDLDDDFLALQGLKDHEASAIPNEVLSRLEAGLALADEVWVASEDMASNYARFGSRVRLRATLPPPLPKAGPSGDPDTLRVVYFGTQTHRRDWQIVEQTISELVEDGIVSCTLVGVNPDSVPIGVRSELVEANVISRYLAFMRYVAQQGPFDVGIAPLQFDAFASGKSGLKVFEYLSMGLIPVASPVGPYRWLRDAEPLLTPGSSRQWRETLTHLSHLSPKKREVLRINVDRSTDLDKLRFEQRACDRQSLQGLVSSKVRFEGDRI